MEEIAVMKDPDGLCCALCGVRACTYEPNTKKLPSFCPMEAESEQLAAIERTHLEDGELRKLACESARTESAGYCRNTRIQEIMDFAHHIGATRLGIAHCVGLIEEAKIAREIFLGNGFEVEAICCKVGSIEKEKLGLKDEEKVHPGCFEALCNPVAQATLLAGAGTQLNVVIDLCVGHDSLFFMHSRAPVTVLVAKDRVLGHNPVAALYTSHSYYRRLKEQQTK
ncbi:MAG: DUF1847 domain-containing protein [Bryobacteraceae bacterium]